MSTSTCLSMFLQVLLLGLTLSQSSAQAPQTAKEVVDAAVTSVRAIKLDFENVKLKRDRDFTNRLFEVITANIGEFYRSIDEEIFKQEDSKAVGLIESTKEIPEQSCVTRQRELITAIKDRETRMEYRYCIVGIESEVRQVREKLTEAQNSVNILATQAEQKIAQCQRVYNLRMNMSQLQTCVVEAQDKIKQVSTNLDNSLKTLSNQRFVTNLGSCIDKTILTAKKALNTNYDVVQKCFAGSSNQLAKKIADLIPSFKLDVSSNINSEVTDALTKLKAKPAVTLENANKLKTKVNEIVNRRNRNVESIQGFLANNTNVVKYSEALFNASLFLGRFSDAKPCVDSAQNRFRDNLITRSNDIRRCLDGVRQTITVADVTNLENGVVDRQRSEAQVSVVLCLTSSGTVATNNIAACSAQADISFQNYLDSVENKLNEINQKADVITSQINSCEKLTIPSLISTQYSNKYALETCLMTRLSLNYTLQID